MLIDSCLDKNLNIIGKEYDISIEENLRKDVSVMCNLSQGIEEKGIASVGHLYPTVMACRGNNPVAKEKLIRVLIRYFGIMIFWFCFPGYYNAFFILR